MSIDRIGTSSVGYYSSVLISADDLALELGGDTNAQVAAMVLLNAKESRESAQLARDAQESSILAAENEQIEQLHDQADAIRAGASKQAAGDLFAGATEIASGFLPAGDNGHSGRAILQGAGKTASASAGFFAAQDRFEAARHEAGATSADNAADRVKRALDEINSTIDDARDLQRTAIDFLQSAREGEASANQAAIYRRA